MESSAPVVVEVALLSRFSAGWRRASCSICASSSRKMAAPAAKAAMVGPAGWEATELLVAPVYRTMRGKPSARAGSSRGS